VAIGLLFGIANIGTALGPFIGGLLTEQLSWRWVFFLNVPLSAIAIFCCMRWLPSMPPAATKVRIDWLGLISRIVKDGGVVELAERAERVVVLTRQGCHLCDEAIAEVAAVCADTGERYATVDVDSDPELQRRYTDQVPVTFVDGAQHDFWRVDPVRLKAALLRSR
jgi:glutaredoxin